MELLAVHYAEGLQAQNTFQCHLSPVISYSMYFTFEDADWG